MHACTQFRCSENTETQTKPSKSRMTEKEPKGNFWEDGHILGHKGAVIPGLFIAQTHG